MACLITFRHNYDRDHICLIKIHPAMLAVSLLFSYLCRYIHLCNSLSLSCSSNTQYCKSNICSWYNSMLCYSVCFGIRNPDTQANGKNNYVWRYCLLGVCLICSIFRTLEMRISDLKKPLIEEGRRFYTTCVICVAFFILVFWGVGIWKAVADQDIAFLYSEHNA